MEVFILWRLDNDYDEYVDYRTNIKNDFIRYTRCVYQAKYWVRIESAERMRLFFESRTGGMFVICKVDFSKPGVPLKVLW